ncbi:hypothetical protein AB9G22_03875 [Francisella philomiragia]|uniref:hypothetical protein n=1 Tax=Francisella philomiragia TaxID=28110 RepID=UPI0035154ACE
MIHISFNAIFRSDIVIKAINIIAKNINTHNLINPLPNKAKSIIGAKVTKETISSILVKTDIIRRIQIKKTNTDFNIKNIKLKLEGKLFFLSIKLLYIVSKNSSSR